MIKNLILCAIMSQATAGGTPGGTTGGGGGGGDPHFANVVLLIHGDGAHGSTTLTDTKGHVFTQSGASSITTVESVFGGSSIVTGGASNDCFRTPDSPDWHFGTGDYTVEFRMKTTATGYACPISQYPGWVMQIQQNGVLRWYIGDPSGNDILTPSPVNDNTWKAIAVCRQAGVLYLFVDGILVATKADTTNMADVNAELTIGNLNYGYNQGYGGWIDEIRITKGVARYTSNYTIATGPFPDA